MVGAGGDVTFQRNRQYRGWREKGGRGRGGEK